MYIYKLQIYMNILFYMLDGSTWFEQFQNSARSMI